MHPLIVLIALIMASTFSVIFLMRREHIPHLKSGWVTSLIVILGIPVGLFVLIGFLARFS